jgi:predicted ATPase/DNA-binding SARP family transcriptional activator
MAERAHIDFRLLGAVEADRDGVRLPVGGPRQQSLLSLLLLEADRPVRVDRLIDELWAGAPPDGADVTLRSYVSRLRAALGEDAAITASPAGYAIAVGVESIDARRFGRLIREADDVLARRNPIRARELLAEALGLWRGVPFGELATYGSLRVEAERLGELRLHALELRIEADLELGGGPALVDELEALINEHPYRERLWGHLMLALYRSGRQADALDAYRRARARLDEELGLQPGEELERLQLAILRHEVSAPVPPELRHNLPAPLSDFVGRSGEVTAVGRFLDTHRLVTLTGVGGVGKTRLALEAARQRVTRYPDGVWFVDLASIDDPTFMPGLVAAALDIREHAEPNSVRRLAGHLRDRDLLILLDNCEHLQDGVAAFAVALLETAPALRILATSRARLGIAGEVDYPVSPLGVPADPGEVAAARGSEAVALFLNRAIMARPALALDDANVLAAARICHALDGLPLAMELAAARAMSLSLEDIASRIHDRFRFLVSWRRLSTARHRTLRAAMDWSYDLLSPEERNLFARLAVFADGLTLDGAANVCAGGDEPQALDRLEALVDASLVLAHEESGRMRYLLLETVRQYAAERLEATGDGEATRRAHARYFLGLVKSANLSPEDPGSAGPQAPRLIEPEEANIRAALGWALDHDIGLGLELAIALENFWVTRDPSEADRWLGALLAQADSVDPVLRARATRDYASMAHVLGDFEEAEARYRRSKALFEAGGDARGVAELTFRLGILARRRGDFAAARRDTDESLAGFRQLRDRGGEVQVLTHLALVEFEEGNLDRGFEVIEEALAMARDIGWTWWEIQVLGVAARWLLVTGRIDEGERHAQQALQLTVEPGYRTDQIRGLVLLAWAAAERGDHDRASVLWTAAKAETTAQPVATWGAGWAAIAPGLESIPKMPAPLPLAEAVRLALSDS